MTKFKNFNRVFKQIGYKTINKLKEIIRYKNNRINLRQNNKELERKKIKMQICNNKVKIKTLKMYFVIYQKKIVKHLMMIKKHKILKQKKKYSK